MQSQSKEEEESVHGSSMKSTVIVDNSMMHATNGTSETGETTLKRSNDSDPDVLRNKTTKESQDELGELREKETTEEIVVVFLNSRSLVVVWFVFPLGNSVPIKPKTANCLTKAWQHYATFFINILAN